MLSGTCPVAWQHFVRVHVSRLSPQLFVLRYGYRLSSQRIFSLETAGMRKKDWTMIVLIIAVLLLILIVYFIFEKRIEAIPDKINWRKPIPFEINENYFTSIKLKTCCSPLALSVNAICLKISCFYWWYLFYPY